MTISRSVSVALIASMLSAGVPNISWAGDEVVPQTPVDLRAAITIGGLAATYFVVKEMQKQTDELVAQQQR